MDERALADNLDRFLDELAAGPAGDRPALDPGLTEITRRYRALGRTPAPAGARTRVWQGLTNQASAGEESLAIGPISPNGMTSSSRWSGSAPATGQIGSERRWGFMQLAIAAVLLLAGLGIGYIVIGPGWPADDKRTTIPAAVEPAATPGPVPVTVSAPVTGISGNNSMLVMRRLTLEPGSTYQEFAYGTTLFVIEQGTLTAGSLERGEQLLGPNGSGSVQNGRTLTLRNDSDVTGVVFVVFVYSPATMNPQVGDWPGVTAVTLETRMIPGTLPVHATMTLQRLTVPAGEQAASWQTDGPAVLRVEQGEAGLTLTGDEVPSPFASGVERIQSSGRTVQVAPGTAVDVRNSGTTPLMLTIVGISPGSAPDSAPAT